MMPVRDRADLLATAVGSVLAQSESDFELIILDDGSTDGSWHVATALAAADERIVLLRNRESAGIPAARNRILAAARGRYLAICDSDDVSRPTRFEAQRARLQQDASLVGVGCRFTTFDGADPDAGSEPGWHWGLRDGREPFLFASGMFRTEAVRAVGGFDTRYALAEDVNLAYRLAAAGGRFAIVDEVLVHYRIHPGGITSQDIALRERKLLRAQLAGLRVLRGRFSPRGYAVLVQTTLRLGRAAITR
jgi:glycosyltransferase involved in cell wall biosynthesis